MRTTLAKIAYGLMLLSGCSTMRNERNIASDWVPAIDREFIQNSIGKTFPFERPNPSDGEPNCVAAALRGGGYLPAFALNGTDSFYDHILPICFSKISPDDAVEEGNLGIIYKKSIPTLTHVVLFLGSDQIFEKPGPNPEDHFRLNSWKNYVNDEVYSKSKGEYKFEVWRFYPQANCPLAAISRQFERNINLKKLSQEIDQRIFAQDWTPSAGLRKKLLADLDAIEAAKNHWARSLSGGFKLERDYPDLSRIDFEANTLKMILYSPVAK